jgi:hypothetical protein
MAEDIDSGHDDPEFPHDWRGNDIGVFTRVIHKPSTRYADFRIGTVTGFTKTGRLRVEITEDQFLGELAEPYTVAVLVKNVTVLREAGN